MTLTALTVTKVLPRRLWWWGRVLLLVALATFYVAGATEHARTVNDFKARADQSAYLWDAGHVYDNWHGRTPEMLIGQRMRMTVYPAFLALFYVPGRDPQEFFDVAKTWNIRLSVVLLAVLAVVFARSLPPLLSMNLTLIVAFGYFVFRAGYSQPELLFYFLFFLAFLGAWHLLVGRDPVRDVWLGAITGVLAGLAHLTKGVVPPFMVLLAAALALKAVARFARSPEQPAGARVRRLAWRLASVGMMALCFLAVVYPYISNSKRVFGEYFFNVNTAYYIWYDNGADARGAILPHTDPEGRIDIPRSQLPKIRQYWRHHTLGQIAGRLANGFQDMLVRSYRTFWYLKYVTLYLCLGALLIGFNRRAFAQLVRQHAVLAVFLVVYAAVYSTSIALFCVTSDTGTTRFLEAHLAPLLFVLSCLFDRAPFSETRWNISGLTTTVTHIHALVFVTLMLDVVFTIWPRLMTTYGGF
ncbi:MAG TPA: hypothetical protein VGK32_11080 [Vicinamibacterales bacterium]|jgi:hypothetical protein